MQAPQIADPASEVDECTDATKSTEGLEASTATEGAGTFSAEPTGSILELRKQPSCMGSLLASATKVPLGERVTMLGGMLAHPSVGVYPYRGGPASTIAAVHFQAPGETASLPEVIQQNLAKHLHGGTLDMFFVVSDMSTGGFANSTAVNIMHHPWCYPHVQSRQTAGAGRLWHVGVHVPKGGGAHVHATVRPTASRRRDAEPESAKADVLAPTSVHVHPGTGGELCCSPNNVRLLLDRGTGHAPVAVAWAVCVDDAVRPAAAGARTGGRAVPRACVSLHWLVLDAQTAKNLASFTDEAATVRDFVELALEHLGRESVAASCVRNFLGSTSQAD